MRYQLRHGLECLNYLMDITLYKIFKIILNILKKHGEKIDNPSIRIYVNKIENRITFKLKTGYYLKLLMLERKKSLGSTKSKITNDKNGENVPHLEITEVALILCDFVDNNYQQDLRVLFTFIPSKSFGQLLNISPEHFIFLKSLDSEF